MTEGFKILLAWESAGHPDQARRLDRIGRWAVGRGLVPIIAARDVSAFPVDGRYRVIQAPVWPMDLHLPVWTPLHPDSAGQSTGLKDLQALPSMISAWQTLFDGFAPRLVVADNAPAAVLAARGRVQCVTIWDLEPVSLAAEELKQIDQAIGPGQPPTAANALAGDLALRFGLPGFTEGEGVLPTGLSDMPLASASASAKGVHFHLSREASQNDVLMGAVMLIGGPKSLWAPGLPDQVRMLLENGRVDLRAREPGLHDASISADLVAHSGGPEFTQQLLFAGIAQVVISTDPATAWAGERIARLGAGQHIAMDSLTVPDLKALTAKTEQREAMRNAAMTEARRLRDLDVEDWSDAMERAISQAVPVT